MSAQFFDELDENGAVVRSNFSPGAHSNGPPPGHRWRAHEVTPDELAALDAQAAALAQSLARTAEARADTQFKALAELTPAAAKAMIDTVFPNLTAAQRNVLKGIVLALCILARRV